MLSINITVGPQMEILLPQIPQIVLLDASPRVVLLSGIVLRYNVHVG